MKTNPLPSRHSLSKKIALSFGGVIVLAGLGLGSLPWILSTTPGTAWLCKKVNEKTGVELQVGTLSLSWFGSQQLLNVTGEQKEQQLSFSCPQITTTASLCSILLNQEIGDLILKNPHLTLSKPFKPSASLKRSSPQVAGMIPDIQIELSQFPWKGEVSIQEGSMKFDAPDLDLLEFDKIQLQLHVMESKGFQGILHCVTLQKGVQGTIELTGSLSSANQCTFKAAITQLPTRGIDQLATLLFPDYSGLLYNLIGPTLNLQCSLNSQADSGSIHIEALSSLVMVDLAAQSSNGVLSLTQPATLECQITPSLIEKLGIKVPSLKNLKLTSPTTLQLNIAQLQSPFPLNKASVDATSFQAELRLTPQTKGTLQTAPFMINTLTLSGSSPSFKESISWKGFCQISMQADVGELTLEGNLTQPLSDNKEGNISVATKQFPLTLLNEWGGDLGPLLGTHVDMTTSIDLNALDPHLNFSWHSSSLTIPSLNVSLKGPWKLTAPAPFSYTLNPTLIQGGILSELTAIQGSIQRFELAPHNWQGLQFEASLNTEKVVLQDSMNQSISSIQLILSANTLNKIAALIKSDKLNASLSGSLNTEKNTFSLTQPLTAQYALQLPQLTKPTNLQLAVDPFTFSLSDPLSNGVKGQFFCAEAQFNTAEPFITLQNTVMPFQWNEKEQRLTTQISSQTKGEEKENGSIQGQCTISPQKGSKKLELATASLEGNLHLSHLSSELLDIVMERPYMSLLLGTSFSADCHLNSTLMEQNISLKWTSPALKFDSSFTLNETGVKLQSPCPIIWNLTPEAYRTLDRLITKQRQTAFGLSAPSQFTALLSKFFLPVTTKEEIQLFSDRFFPLAFQSDQLELVGTVTNPELTFIDKSSKETLSLSNLNSSIHKITGQTPFTSTLDSAVSTQNAQSSKSGSVSCLAKVDLPQGQDKTFDLSKCNAAIQLQAKQIPSRVLDLFARASGRTDQPFTTLFGPTMHLVINTDLKELSGPIQFNLNTPTTQAELSGHLVNGALLLDKPFFSQLLVTKESSQLLLKEINPLDLSYIYSQSPVMLQIPEKGFYLPIYPWAPEKMSVPDASIELGKVVCRNEGNVNITLGLLKSKQFNKNQDLTLWFAPIDLSINTGVVNLERTELLIADTFDICTWGKIDLGKEYVDMTLGLTAQTLSQAFGIKNLPENYVLTIPMKGKMDNVQINTDKATAKVALLLAWQHKDIAAAFGGGPAAAIAGDLLGAIATLPDAKANVPPPKHPFPWEIGQERKQPSQKSKKKMFKTSDKPLKQIMKVIR